MNSIWEPRSEDEAMAGEYDGLNWLGYVLALALIAAVFGTFYALVQLSHWLAGIMEAAR